MVEDNTDQVEGRNAVRELLNSGRDINKIFIQKGERHGSILDVELEDGILVTYSLPSQHIAFLS